MGKGCKVVVCGLASVGKTAILEQLLYGNHTAGQFWSSYINMGKHFSETSIFYCTAHIVSHRDSQH